MPTLAFLRFETAELRRVERMQLIREQRACTGCGDIYITHRTCRQLVEAPLSRCVIFDRLLEPSRINCIS